MNYRQWKKNYKKRYGVNPPASIDKRKRRKQAARAIKALAYADLSAALKGVAEGIINGIASAMRAFGNACDGAGTVLKNAADTLQPLEIKGRVFSWQVGEYGNTHYAVYEINALGGADELRAITYSRKAAEKIVEILENDHLEHVRSSQPERIQKRQDVADVTTYVAQMIERGGVDTAGGMCEKPECESCPFPPCEKPPEKKGAAEND